MVPKKILFCTDFSDNSRPAFELAVDFAKGFDAELLILHVIDQKHFPGHVDWPERLHDLFESLEQSANAHLQSLARESEKSVKEVKTSCRRGLTPKAIVELARDESVDLIVVGTHGRTGVKHLVMGSVARTVLKTAHRPVLIVEGPAEEGESYESTG